jgi:hypothetical protein
MIVGSRPVDKEKDVEETENGMNCMIVGRDTTAC